MEVKKNLVEEEALMNMDLKDQGLEPEEEGPLPGFRFHPTDEELVGFYLKRKVENRRPLSIEIIKQIDIYKHDPWDLTKSKSVGEREWYFYCKRGRKYRNSIRPNRVTGSGFWKATGIDRPIYGTNDGEHHHCIGLKKSLVYYRGTAGKGTKTDWMMHEFRLPTTTHPTHPSSAAAQEAEIWTLCRILKRNKRQTTDWREISARKNNIGIAMNSCSKASSVESSPNHQSQHYISFATLPNLHLNHHQQQQQQQQQQLQQQQWSSVMTSTPSTTSTYSSSFNNLAIDDDKDMESFGCYGHHWDDLSSVIEFASKSPLV